MSFNQDRNRDDEGELWEVHMVRAQALDSMKDTMIRTRNESMVLAANLLSQINRETDTVEKVKKTMLAQKLRELCDDMEAKISAVDSQKAKLKRKALKEKKIYQAKQRDNKISEKELNILDDYEKALVEGYQSRVQFAGEDPDDEEQEVHRGMIAQLQQFKKRNKLDKRREQYEEYVRNKDVRAAKAKRDAKKRPSSAKSKPTSNLIQKSSTLNPLKKTGGYRPSSGKSQYGITQREQDKYSQGGHSNPYAATTRISSKDKLAQREREKKRAEYNKRAEQQRKEMLESAYFRRQKEYEAMDADERARAKKADFELRRKRELAEQRKQFEQEQLAAEQHRRVMEMQAQEEAMAKAIAQERAAEARARQEAMAAERARVSSASRKDKKQPKRRGSGGADQMKFGKETDYVYRPNPSMQYKSSTRSSKRK